MQSLPESQVIMSDGEWDELIHKISLKECVIVLGPGAAIDETGKQLHNSLCHEIADKLGTASQDTQDRIFGLCETLISRNGGRAALARIVKNNFANAKPNDLHYQLAELPISLYISGSLDMMLTKAMNEKGYKHSFSYFQPRETSIIEDIPDLSNPLVYNLFGCFKDEYSWVITHDQLFEFLFAFLGVRPIPEVIHTSIKNAKSFVFLGFDFQSWYLKLILRKFELHTKHKHDRSYAVSPSDIQPTTVQFYNEKFNLFFVNNTSRDIEQFVSELHSRCLDSEETQHLMRKETATKISIREEVLKLLSSLQIEEAFDRLRESCVDKDNLDILTVLKYQYRTLENEIIKGTRDFNSITVERAHILDRLIKFTDRF